MIRTAEFSLLDWLDEYVAEREIAPTTVVTYRAAVNSFSRWSGGEPSISKLAERINEYLCWRSSVGSRQTARCYRAALVALLRSADEAGLVGLPRKIRPVRPPDHFPDGFTLGELRRLIDHATPRQRAAILLVYDTGLRRGDVFRVRWSQVAGMTLRLVVGKSGRLHAARLSAATLDALMAARDGDRLVPWSGGFKAWRREWRRLGDRADVPVVGRGLQAIRRTAASLVAKEHGEHAAAAFLSHSTASGVAVFRKYYRVGEILDQPPPSPPPIE